MGPIGVTPMIDGGLKTAATKTLRLCFALAEPTL
jgi:hypothetical protein